MLVDPARADDQFDSKSSAAVYRDIEQGFVFTPPVGFQQTGKPLPTHLKEVQFAPGAAAAEDDDADANANAALPKSYQYGITVDPIRIQSLREFGTPQQVAAKVVAAELNRDGVFVVTLVKDPVEEIGSNDEAAVAYVLNYKSQGKRGDKRFVCKFYIAQNRLYALTAQCKEDDYPRFEKQIDEAVSTFKLLLPA
jgi:PsbP